MATIQKKRGYQQMGKEMKKEIVIRNKNSKQMQIPTKIVNLIQAKFQNNNKQIAKKKGKKTKMIPSPQNLFLNLTRKMKTLQMMSYKKRRKMIRQMKNKIAQSHKNKKIKMMDSKREKLERKKQQDREPEKSVKWPRPKMVKSF